MSLDCYFKYPLNGFFLESLSDFFLTCIPGGVSTSERVNKPLGLFTPMVCLPLEVVEVGHWVVGDDAFKDNQRLSPSCNFVKGLFVGNTPVPAQISQQQPSSSYDV